MKQRALIDIDLVLDTRYGTLQRIDPEVADALAATPFYRNRHHDNFDILTMDVVDLAQYQDLYKRRDVETLFHARMTDFVYMLRKDVEKALPELFRGVRIEGIEFDLNTWPYELDDREAETIRRAFARYIPAPTKVNVVRYPPETLTPEFVDTHYEMMAWYNHEDWLIPHAKALLEKPIPLVVLLTPTISTSGSVPEPTPEIRNPFHAREMVMVQFIALHYIPTSYACFNPFILQQIRNQPH